MENGLVLVDLVEHDVNDRVSAATDTEEVQLVQSLESCNCHPDGAGVQLRDAGVGLVTSFPDPIVLN